MNETGRALQMGETPTNGAKTSAEGRVATVASEITFVSAYPSPPQPNAQMTAAVVAKGPAGAGAVAVAVHGGSSGTPVVDGPSGIADEVAAASVAKVVVVDEMVTGSTPPDYERVMGSLHAVVRDYSPTLKDELGLNIGDQVVLNRCFEDGWGRGSNLTTLKHGMFPIMCISDRALVDKLLTESAVPNAHLLLHDPDHAPLSGSSTIPDRSASSNPTAAPQTPTLSVTSADDEITAFDTRARKTASVVSVNNGGMPLVIRAAP
ncbi:hypothetical protein HK101_006618, partial [Irineochytrium annulatum]